MKKLNLGCGKYYLEDWINIDFTKTSENVIAYNLLNGIPFKDDEIDVIYNSHLFEHFDKESGIKFIKECFRVLKPNGIFRIVVPDLEGIVKEYLVQLEKSLLGDKNAQTNYEWIVIELLDQMVRNSSGGEMIKVIRNKKSFNEDYIIDRVGFEAKDINQNKGKRDKNNLKKDLFKQIYSLIYRIKIKVAKTILGRDAKLIEIGSFRMSGENHLWMYDRFSLSNLLKECLFSEVCLTDAYNSKIPDWEQQNIDLINGAIRQPNSLYIEAIK